jgi:hypothetical protein
MTVETEIDDQGTQAQRVFQLAPPPGDECP